MIQFFLDNSSDMFKIIEDKRLLFNYNHNSKYTSLKYTDMVKSNNSQVLLLKTPNSFSLDNKEIEFWFFNLKHEWPNYLTYKKLAYNKLKNKNNNCINWYNKERI
ncbi:hypothetical protein QLQ80_03010 [Mycoplasma sp. M5725]|uniref:Uncharacterized protein n=1 Tax=Mycoplasma phocimorsus TaxID=3045839 RepID=A0AAJ1UZS4_9MOLU|nr:hypothetical protein [Mycoplasma phocimorsus]MDJ1646033.1 hypothetical protein [Mycoplasma phocimorsus]